jgi:hypothetical protein
MEDEYGDVIATIVDPHEAWVILESSYGSQQSGTQAVELTLARWDGRALVSSLGPYEDPAHSSDRCGSCRHGHPNLSTFHKFAELPADYDMAVAIHDPIPHQPTMRTVPRY